MVCSASVSEEGYLPLVGGVGGEVEQCEDLHMCLLGSK